ncbi:ATP-dependent DNA helicase RecQ-like [Ruditapes philippinarum]|uniref:ATP-dependent DNA helicase RecQ-like n=1 Tax=Ruditapes philippinarum TaxID=129788 RepID=UPI00295B0CEF|nr:ATP-dependent DNA helicase RecQ-like [Ruditapes philippinarum]
MDEILSRVLNDIGFVKPLKDCQKECLTHVLCKRDVLAILPTGYGKSLIFQVAPFALKVKYNLVSSVCIILTPLNSIMMDQINSLKKQGIDACWLDFDCQSGQALADDISDDEEDTVPQGQGVVINVPLEDIITGKFTLVYAHPEALLSTGKGTYLLSAMERKSIISCIAIDEAHMILEWGNDFRKDFSKIGSDILARFTDIPVMVFTATASPDAQTKICKSLQLKNPKIVSMNPDRTNIKYTKIERPPSSNTQDHLDEILEPMVNQLLEEKDNYPLTIFYTDTNVISYAYAYFEKKMGKFQYLAENIPENRLFAQYHTNYTEKMKKFIVQELGKEKPKMRVVFATVALGMGLNAPHIRVVIHYKPPTSIEKYFQETGRAGRDGLPSKAILYYNNTDIRKNRPGIQQNIIEYCKNDSNCLREVMLKTFAVKKSENIEDCCCICDKDK